MPDWNDRNIEAFAYAVLALLQHMTRKERGVFFDKIRGQYCTICSNIRHVNVVAELPCHKCG
jgi:hypothetical protein